MAKRTAKKKITISFNVKTVIIFVVAFALGFGTHLKLHDTFNGISYKVSNAISKAFNG